MSEKLEQQTPNIEENDNNVEDIDIESVENLSKEDELVSTEVEIPIEEQPSENEEAEIIIQDYLDPSILDIKVVSEDEIDKYEEEVVVSKNLNEKYLESFSDIKQREVVLGSVVGITERDVLIDIGFKAEGIVSRSEFNELPEIGEEVDVYIRTFEDRRGNLLLSKEKADFQKRWQQIRDCFTNEELITGTITRRIKGGMVVDLGVVQAFLPGSQLDIKPITDFDEFLNMESEFKIVKLNELRQNIVLSRKAILEGDLVEKRQEVLGQMEVGMILDGIVKNITDFGAFVDLGGVDGLLHITDITWGRINHPTDRLDLGQTVTVKVIDFDVEKIRVSLGMKQLVQDPWENILEKYPIDSVIEGKVVSLMNYGIFVELEDGVEGLIHISEMSWVRHIKHPSDIFSTGEKVSAKILNIDVDDKKISMGIKQLQDNPWDDIETKYPIGTEVEGFVRNLTQFGAFIELEEGIDGLVHVSDMSWTKLVRHPIEILQKDDKVKVKVLEVSIEEKRLSLGIKQLKENPWEKIKKNFPSGKVIQASALKVLDKGIIFEIENSLEGLVPVKRLTKSDKEKISKKFKEGSSHKVTVQEVDEDLKKIILMLDLELDNDEKSTGTDNDNTDEVILDEPASETIEIPQEVIDKVSDDEKADDGANDSIDSESSKS